MQINFGVIFDESLGDAVKITVIATGFQPESSPRPEPRNVTHVVKVQQRPPDPEPLPDFSYVAAPPPEPEPAPAPVADSEPALLEIDMDDIDTPAYLRQGRLLN